jgi:hypothetical protein
VNRGTGFWVPIARFFKLERFNRDLQTIANSVRGKALTYARLAMAILRNYSPDLAPSATDNREESDRYWNAIVGNGGKESPCGWCKDRWGLSWQITARALTEPLAAGGGEAKRAFEAMMQMKKINIATIETARRR